MSAERRAEVSVGAVVVVDDRILLIERGRGVGAGWWSIPGGRVEFGEAMEQAVRRELHEETGLTATTVRHLGFVERIGDEWHYLIHDYLVEVTDPEAAAAADDAAAVAWWPLGELQSHPRLVPGLVDFLVDVGVLRRPSSSASASR